MTGNLLRICTSIVVILLSGGCLGGPGGHLSDEESRFLSLPFKERDAAIQRYPFDKQIDLYLAATLKNEPPDLGIADSVARGGAALVPVLTKRLVEERGDFAKMSLIDVYYRMQRLGYYSVASDSQLMTVLEDQVALIKDAQWKERSRNLLGRIKTANEKPEK